jgi:hypothetical protein
MKKKYILLLSIALNAQKSEEKKEGLVICDGESCVVIEKQTTGEGNLSQGESASFEQSTERMVRDFIAKKCEEEEVRLNEEYAELQKDFEKCFSEISLQEILGEEMLSFQAIFLEGIKETLGERYEECVECQNLYDALSKEAALRLIQYKEKLAAEVSQALFALEENIRQQKLALLADVK